MDVFEKVALDASKISDPQERENYVIKHGGEDPDIYKKIIDHLNRFVIRDRVNMREKNSKSYTEKLKDPRWQKKRLRILERDNFTCRFCGDNENTLHVHHIKYFKNPWDSYEEDLITLCEICHITIEELKSAINNNPIIKSFMPQEWENDFLKHGVIVRISNLPVTPSAFVKESINTDGIDPLTLKISYAVLMLGFYANTVDLQEKIIKFSNEILKNGS